MWRATSSLRTTWICHPFGEDEGSGDRSRRLGSEENVKVKHIEYVTSENVTMELLKGDDGWHWKYHAPNPDPDPDLWRNNRSALAST